MLVEFALLGFVGLMALAALFDVTRYTIPNWLCLCVAAGFPIAAILAGMGWTEIGLHLLVGFGALVFGMALFAPGWIGGGDAKLFAAAALWFGWPDTGLFLLYTALIGGGLSFLLISIRKFVPVIEGGPAWLNAAVLSKDAAVPYGVALAGGALWVLPNTPWMLSL